MAEVIFADRFDKETEAKRLATHVGYKGTPKVLSIEARERRGKKPVMTVIVYDTLNMEPSDSTPSHVYGVGKARCCPTDDFDPVLGARIALGEAVADLKVQRENLTKALRSQKRRMRAAYGDS